MEVERTRAMVGLVLGETAAVLGRRISFDVLLAVTGLDEPSLIAELRGLIGHGLAVVGLRHGQSSLCIKAQ